jgi:hypothetical protein
MLLTVVFWSFLIVVSPYALDLALELTVEIARSLAAIFKEAFARPGNVDRLASRSWSRLSSH